MRLLAAATKWGTSLFLVLAPALGLAQPPPVVDLEFGDEGVSKARKADALSQRVRSIEIRGGWSNRVALPLRVCDVLTTEKISEAMNTLRLAITGEGQAKSGRLPGGGEIEVLLIDVDYDTTPGSGKECDGAARTVGVVLKPYHVHLSLERVGDNVLPLPRSPLATLQENLPAPLQALQPRVGISHDRSFGTSLDGQAGFDGESVQAHARIRESLDAGYYQTNGSVTYRRREYRLRAGGEASREPLAGRDDVRHAADLGMGLTLNLSAASPLFLDTAVRRVRDRLSATDSTAATNLLANRALIDKLVPSTRGFFRASVWQDNGRTDGAADFQRLAARAGYAQEFRVRPNETLGFEVVAGAGKLWGDAPIASRFYGGNAPTQFLYDSPASQQMFAMPRGPLVRSLGQAQAGLGAPGSSRGGSSYWHLNVNLALPVRGWSRPLIPDEPAGFEDKDGRPVSLKQVLRRQVDVTGPSLLAAALKNQGLSEKEASEQAKKALAEIQPAAHYIIEDAYLFAVRPLLMLDAAGLAGGDGGRSDRWVALGAGLSLTIVVARFEAGYMRTVSGPQSDERHGAFFMRLVFQNLF